MVLTVLATLPARWVLFRHRRSHQDALRQVRIGAFDSLASLRAAHASAIRSGTCMRTSTHGPPEPASPVQMLAFVRAMALRLKPYFRGELHLEVSGSPVLTDADPERMKKLLHILVNAREGEHSQH